MIGLDTETTGMDFRHDSKPYLVTTCNGKENTWWEWVVDPTTRQPEVPKSDLAEIQEVIDGADLLVLQGAKFDYTALQTVFKGKLRWDWSKVRDTLVAGHLLASNQPHDLTTMAMVYCGINLQPYEDKIKKITVEARKIALGLGFVLASDELTSMPSTKGSSKKWKLDMWVPRVLAKRLGKPKDDPWFTACHDYANSDPAATLLVYQEQEKHIKKLGLWKIYLEKLKSLSVAFKMEDVGVSLNRSRLEKLKVGYVQDSAKFGTTCTEIAQGLGYELALPKGGNNKSLNQFLFGREAEDCCSKCKGTGSYRRKTCGVCSGTSDGLPAAQWLNLRTVKQSPKTGKPSLDKVAIEIYLSTLPPKGVQYRFVDALRAKRKRDTSVMYMEAYKRFWLPTGKRHRGKKPEWYRLHPNLNPTGTDTLRWSSANPNEQNISKQDIDGQAGKNLRHCFGPLLGREWWSLDAENIELRIPAYQANEEEMIQLFERPNDPPYFGSYHLLVFDILHPDKFKEHGKECKQIYAGSWYQWIKNGNFAVQYGAVESSGTADRAYHVKGAQHRLQRRFSKVKTFGNKMIAYAKKHGHVETLPDKTVDPMRGYPLLCSRSNWGNVLPTIPLNYHTQGTAGWWMMKAMIRCQAYLDTLNAERDQQYHMIMQVHDELVFDFPKLPPRNRKPGNLPKIKAIKKLMERGGNDIGIPTPVGVDYHPNNWAEGVTV